MYKSFYNLDNRPFAANPDPAFLWLGEKQKEVLTVLRYGIRENKGFLLLTGDAGIGKTILINALIENVGKDVEWAVIGDPSLERLDFYNAIAKGFKIDKEFTSKVQFLIQFSNYLHKAYDDDKKVLLIVDDCHRLSQDMLEELRLLSNIEKEEAKLINIFFVGRREFNDVLVQPKNRALRQRLTLKAELVALTQSETDDYIRHRLNIAGGQEKMFTAKAVQIIHRSAKGIPRLINIICDHVMVAGSVQGKRTLDHLVVEGCLQRLNLPVNPSSNDFAGLADEKSHLQHFRGRFTADSSATATTVSGFNLEGDRRWVWIKYIFAGILVVVTTGSYLYFTVEQPREAAQVNGETIVQQPAKTEMAQVISSPAVSMLEQNEQAITEKKAAVLKQTILEKAYSGVDDKSREKASVQSATTEIAQEQGIGDQVPTAVKKTAPDSEPEPKLADTKKAADDSSQDPGKSQAPAQAGTVKGTVVASAQQSTADTAAQASRVESKPATMPPLSAVAEKAARPATMEPNKVVLGLLPDSLELTGEAAKEYAKFIEKLKNYPRAKLLVKGFVSANTNSPENIKLSEERAMGVQKLLVKSGIEPARIEVKGLGNQEPVAPNTTREGRAKNRRVEIVVVNDGR